MFLDLEKIKEPNQYEILQPGEYVVTCFEAITKANQAGTGEYISTKFKILAPIHSEGRMIFENFTILHPNPKAVEIGLSKLKDFLKKAKAKSFKLDSVTDLQGLKALAVVKHRLDQNGDPQPSISFFKELTEKNNDSIKLQEDIPF